MWNLNLRLFRVLTVACSVGVANLTGAAKEGPRTFATAREALDATVAAAERNDTAELLQLFGPAGKEIVESGDPAQDKAFRLEFARSARERIQVDKVSARIDRVSFTVGEQEWPFPVPVVRKGGLWHLDSPSGRFEILARRIGRNEMNAIDVCRGYAEAQAEYATTAHNDDLLLQYAQQIASSAGQRDGLYSDAAPESLVGRAFAEAARVKQGAVEKRAVAYHGYYFRILKSQGPAAMGGAFDYVVNGKMIGGFALVAWPAEYGVSGIRTLLINQLGVVSATDLGPNTAVRASQIRQYNPDRSWHPMIVE